LLNPNLVGRLLTIDEMASVLYCRARATAAAVKTVNMLTVVVDTPDVLLLEVVMDGDATALAIGTERLPYVAASDSLRLAITEATAVFREAAVRLLADDRASAAWAAATCAMKVIETSARRATIVAVELTEQPVL